MSGTNEHFESLAAQARREIAPVGDVSRATLASIRERRSRQAATRPLLVFAGAYGLVCAIALVFAYQLMGLDSDPMGSFFAMARGIAP